MEADRKGKVLLSDARSYPLHNFIPPKRRAENASKLGAEGLEYFPGWVDLVIGEQNYAQLSVPIELVHRSWWEDRAVEGVQQINSRQSNLLKMFLSCGFPFMEQSNTIVDKITTVTEAYAVTNWPALDKSKITDKARGRIVQERTRAIPPFQRRLVAELHSENILLTGEEIMTWQSEDAPNRRLAIVHPIDPRRALHYIGEEDYKRWINQVLQGASVAYLKVGDLQLDDRRRLSKEDVETAIIKQDKSSAYVQSLRNLSQRIGHEASHPVDYVIKVGPGYSDDFVKAFVNLVRETVV